jgi:peptidoglycan hydrolase-like protein with peptidoglycan-binding domain
MIDTRSLQRFLQASGFPPGPIDGDWGGRSDTAARAYLSSLPRSRTTYLASWAAPRVRLAVEQALINAATGYDLGQFDGLAGARTQVGLEKWQDHVTFERPSPNPTASVAKATVWPRQRDMLAFYGKPGTNHTQIEPPYPVYYGSKMVKKITLNERCAESGLRILERTLSEYGAARIHELGIDRYGGSYANRVMRNGSQLSTHAFAAAWDWDPARNQLRMTHRTAQFAKPEYKGFIDAHEREGWISLGRARDFDWMHFQAARL